MMRLRPWRVPVDFKKLKTCLDELYSAYGRSYLSSDPVEFVHKFKNKKDREIVGLLASSLAYGRVEGIKKSIARVLDIMGWEPYGFTTSFRPEKERKAFSGFKHRFNSGEDVSCLIYYAKQMIKERGSIGGFFLEGYRPEHGNIKNALESFTRRALKLDCKGIYGGKGLPENAGVRFFFPSPSAKSPCKRLNLYLRWMVRKDSVDFHIWKDVDASKLVIPLDTHIARISKYLGLTSRKAADWKMAEEITEGLKKLDPEDPVKYDFALSRLGILEECKGRRKPENCEACLIKNVCKELPLAAS